MPGSRILSDDQLDEMAELRERGWSYRRIADHFTAGGTPIKATTLHWQCLRVGADVPVDRRREASWLPTEPYFRNGRLVRPFSKADDALLLALECQGFGVAVMARRLGRQQNSIRGRLMTLARHDARREDAA